MVNINSLFKPTSPSTANMSSFSAPPVPKEQWALTQDELSSTWAAFLKEHGGSLDRVEVAHQQLLGTYAECVKEQGDDAYGLLENDEKKQDERRCGFYDREKTRLWALFLKSNPEARIYITVVRKDQESFLPWPLSDFTKECQPANLDPVPKPLSDAEWKREDAQGVSPMKIYRRDWYENYRNAHTVHKWFEHWQRCMQEAFREKKTGKTNKKKDRYAYTYPTPIPDTVYSYMNWVDRISELGDRVHTFRAMQEKYKCLQARVDSETTDPCFQTVFGYVMEIVERQRFLRQRLCEEAKAGDYIDDDTRETMAETKAVIRESLQKQKKKRKNKEEEEEEEVGEEEEESTRSKSLLGILLPVTMCERSDPTKEKVHMIRLSVEASSYSENVQGRMLVLRDMTTKDFFQLKDKDVATLTSDGHMYFRNSVYREPLLNTLRSLFPEFLVNVRRLGRRFNVCCNCGRALTNDHSLQLGLGTECVKSWGGEEVVTRLQEDDEYRSLMAKRQKKK